MKARIVITSILLAALWGTGWSEPGDRTAMVLSLKGSGHLASGDALRTGSVLKSGDKVTLTKDSEVSLLLLGKGKRTVARGPLTLNIGDGRIDSGGAALPSEDTPTATIALSGRNFRRMGGAAFRGDLPKTIRMTEPVRDLSLSPTGLLSWKLDAREGEAPPPLELQMSQSFAVASPSADYSKLERVDDQSSFHGPFVVTPARHGKDWVYELQTKDDGYKERGRNFTVQLTLPRQPGVPETELVYTRVTVLDAKDRAQIETQRRDLEKWAADKPADATPYILLATLYDDADMVAEALDAARKALARQPQDVGLQEMVARFYLDIGDYKTGLAAIKSAAGK